MLSRVLILLLVFTLGNDALSQEETRVSGVCLVAPRDSFAVDPMPELCRINCEWLAVVPYAFIPRDGSEVKFGNNHFWWGETPRGAEHTVALAKQNGLKVMLKPHVWMHDKWVGDLEFDNETDWQNFERSYRDYILKFAEIAEKHKVELLCVATEFKLAVQQRPEYWRALIKEIREIYSGPLTYCSNWDSFEDVSIWDAVDYIGVSAYFPLNEKPNPSIKELKRNWDPVKKRLEKISKKYNRKIIFTEYGYLSVDGCAGKTWLLEPKRMQMDPNEQAQANALEALYSSFEEEDYWIGGFLWKWYPNGRVRPGFKERDYTPQDKISEEVIRNWYQEFNTPD